MLFLYFSKTLPDRHRFIYCLLLFNFFYLILLYTRALTRPGRFDSKVHVLLPDVRGRKEILNLYLTKSPIAEGI